MPVLRTETNQLLIYDPGASRSTVHSFLARPTPLEERTLGRLVLLAEIAERSQDNDRILHELEQEICRQYYESEDFQAEAAFERMLQKVNERLHLLLGPALPEWLERTNLVIAVVKETALHFTVIGQLHAFLIHRQRIVDILETSSGVPSQDQASPLKIFTNIISGQLSLEDSLLFCTPSVLDYLSQEKLKRIIGEHNPNDAVRQLENLLAESDSATSFGALVLRLTALPPEARAEEVQNDTESAIHDRSGITRPQTSMEELIRREAKTNELLNHPLWPNLSRAIKTGTRGAVEKMNAAFGRKEDDCTELPEGTPIRAWKAPSEPSALNKATRATGNGLLLLLKAIGVGIGKLFAAIGRSLRRRSVSEHLKNAPTSTNRRLASGASWFRMLTPQRRWILLAALVLIIFAAQSIVSAGNRRAQQQQQQTYTSAITSAREKISAADAALLIKNESGARKSLQDAATTLASIPADQKSYTSDIALLTNQIQAKQQTLRHVVSVDPETVYDLAGLEVGFTAPSFALSSGSLMMFNGSSSSVFSVDPTKKTAATLVDAPSLESPLTYFVGGQPSPALIMQHNGSLQQIDVTTKSLATVPVAYDNADRDLRDAAVYINRLYTLDAKNSAIIRHDKTGAGYAAGSSWLSGTSTTLADAVSLAVDGSVYVLRQSGVIEKFTAGKKDAVTFDQPDPIMQAATSIFAAADITTLFIADGSNRRIVEYGKDGKFLRQYVSDKLANVKRVIVNKGTVYALVGTQIVRFVVTTTS